MRSTFFILIIAVLSLSSWKSKSVSIVGEWYRIYDKSTPDSVRVYSTTEESSFKPKFTFKKNKKVIYSHCTDICGCMRHTYEGNWKRTNDSTYIIRYTKVNRGRGKMPMRRPKEYILTITKKTKDHLYFTYNAIEKTK